MGGPGKNILWVIAVQKEDQAGFHNGADVSPLSQFAGEKEILFPPLTMLRVRKHKPENAGPAYQSEQPEEDEDGIVRLGREKTLLQGDIESLEKQWDVKNVCNEWKEVRVQYKRIGVRPS